MYVNMAQCEWVMSHWKHQNRRFGRYGLAGNAADGRYYADHDRCKDSSVCVRVGGWSGAWLVGVIVCVCVCLCLCLCVCACVCLYVCVAGVCCISRNSQNFCGSVWHDSLLCVVRRTHRCCINELNHPYNSYGTHVNECNAYGISRHICAICVIWMSWIIHTVHMWMNSVTHNVAGNTICVIWMSWIIHTTHMAHMWMNSITLMANVAGNTVCGILIHTCATWRIWHTCECIMSRTHFWVMSPHPWLISMRGATHP